MTHAIDIKADGCTCPDGKCCQGVTQKHCVNFIERSGTVSTAPCYTSQAVTWHQHGRCLRHGG
jgi:hypothetical protein